ncbi:DUF4136 domain-containing protein [Acidovorax sp. HDW3]|uniref:DUF4136 domain-containing protein n=1 Tax=Acidovorax sp. HDW3 TaxID=2714923 RepID=UPI00140D4073|nr:DUF4136 domain-containing protein [Acidovorax sp. HDW3]QIL43089.1 DUF4136 domain-containing protein [Acidovorax sp. HDW3]
MLLFQRCAAALGLVGALLLTGCATQRAVQAEVQSYSQLQALPAPPTYRLELLPSQQAQAGQFAAIEAQAVQALAKVGLQRDEAQPRLVVQISAQARTTLPENWPYGPGGGGWGWGMGWGWHRHGGLGGAWMLDRPPTLQYRSVGIVMRDAQTQQLVYETSATHEEVWSNDRLIFGTLFDAALTGFPHPPAGARQVRSEIPTQ